MPSQSPSTHSDVDKPYKAGSLSLPTEPVLAQFGDCSSPSLGGSCCTSWSPALCKDLDLASLLQIVTALSLRASSKNKAGHGGQRNEEGCVEVAALFSVSFKGCFWGDCIACLSRRMPVPSLSGVQKGVTFLFPPEGGHRLSRTSNARSLYFGRKGCNALYLTHWCWVAGRQTAPHLCSRFLDFGEMSSPPHFPELSK